MSLPKPNQQLTNTALEVADEFPVFPCDENKRPVCSGGFKAATQDPDEIQRLFSIKGAALIGIPTGEASGLSVIDIDVRDGKQGLEWEKKNAEILGLTKKAKTQSDGRHYYYRHSNGLRNRAGIDGCVDIRAEGGYVIYPASAGYEWLNDEEFADFPSDFAASSQAPAPAAPETLDIWGKLTDGRERKMKDMVCAKCADAVREVGFENAFEKVVSEYPDYERLVAPRGESLEADGRGLSEWKKKTRSTLAKFEREGVPPVIRQAERDAATYVYNSSSDQVIRLSDGATFKREPWRIMTGRTLQKDIADELIMVVDSTAFEPSQPRLFFLDGAPVFNVYPICPVPIADGNFQNNAGVDSVIRHIRWMFPEDYEFVLDWLAFNVQNYAQKIRFALVVVGIQGDGKTTLFDKLPRAVLGHQHVVTVGPQQINGQYNEWAVNTGLLCCEEITVNGTSKTQVMEQFKPLVTNDTISVTQRYVDARQVRNTANIVILTNHKNALPIDPNDRRYHVLKTYPDKRAQLPDEAYFKALHDAIEQNGRELRGFFMARDISAFNVNRPPPSSVAKVFMREAQLHETSLRVMEVLRNPTRGIHSQCFSFSFMRDTLRTDFNYELNFRNAEAFMEEIGFIKFPKAVKYDGKSHVIYVHEEVMSQSPSPEHLRSLMNNPDDETAKWLEEDEFAYDE